jgi:hypothetical protein
MRGSLHSGELVEKHRDQWPSSLKRYADLLEAIWVEKRETANRDRGQIETIIAKHVDIDDPEFRNPAELDAREAPKAFQASRSASSRFVLCRGTSILEASR